MRIHPHFSVALALLLLSACQNQALYIHGQTMGTSYVVTIAKPEQVSSLAAIEQALIKRLEEINQSMSTYIADSEISMFNKHTSTTWYPVSQQFATVVAAAQYVSQQSDGAFDITVGALVDMWGFGPSAGVEKMPPTAELRDKLANTSYKLLEVRKQPPALRKHKPGVHIDLSGIAKGYGVDEIARLLEAHGVTNYLVNIGGELRARGTNVQGNKWRVGIKHPLNAETSIKDVTLDGAIATSGDYYNFRKLGDKKITHHIDPQSGYPLEYYRVSVSVLAPTAMMADAWATALSVLGRDRAYILASELGLAVYLVSVKNDTVEKAEIDARWTPAFSDHL